MTVYIVWDQGHYHDSPAYIQEIFSTEDAASFYIKKRCEINADLPYPVPNLKDRLYIEEREVLD